jgi:putative transposase
MSRANPLWGSPRIVGELGKIGIHVAKSTVEKYRVRPRNPPSPTWKAFLNNHVKDLVALDFFVVPTFSYKVLFALVILAPERRRIVHVNVTEHPTAAWTAQQVVDAFPWDGAPRYLLRDRDRIYGGSFRQRIRNMGIDEVIIAPRSPWQNPYVERVIGSIRRELLDHAIIVNEQTSEASTHRVHRLLSSMEDASIAGNGLSRAKTRGATSMWHGSGCG